MGGGRDGMLDAPPNEDGEREEEHGEPANDAAHNEPNGQRFAAASGGCACLIWKAWVGIERLDKEG